MPVMFSLLEDKVPITLVETSTRSIRAGGAMINTGAFGRGAEAGQM
jgi:hypothetical protein